MTDREAMADRRTSERVRSSLRGRISFGAEPVAYDCVVLDVGGGGARVQMPEQAPSPQPLPESFDLYIPQRGSTYRVRVQWQSGPDLGVAFDTVDGEAMGDEPGGMPADFPRRLHQLEQGLAQLRGLTLEIATQLEEMKRALVEKPR